MRESTSGVDKRVAVVAVAFLLLAGFVASGHFHPLPTQKRVSAAHASELSEGRCSFCAARVHTRAVNYHPTAVAIEPLSERPLSPIVRMVQNSSLRSPLFGRAPPVAL